MSPAQEPKIWFTLLEGEQHGPYTFTALVQDARRGQLDPEAGVCRLGWEAWRLARDVPGLFEQELESATARQEQDADSMEQDIKDRDRSDNVSTEKQWENDLRAALRASKPLAADSAPYENFAGDASVSADESPAFRASPGRPKPASKRSPEQKNRIENALIVTFSVLAALLAVVGAAWAATSLGIIRVTFLF